MTDIFKLAKATASGRWAEYLEEKLGLDLNDQKPTGCPVCGEGTDRFTFDDKHGGGEWFCRGPKVAGQKKRKPHYGDGLTLAAEYLTKASGQEVKAYDIAHDVVHHFGTVTDSPLSLLKVQAKRQAAKAKRTKAEEQKFQQTLAYIQEAHRSVKQAAKEDDESPIRVAVESHPYFRNKKLGGYLTYNGDTGTVIAKSHSGFGNSPRCIAVPYVDLPTESICGVELIDAKGNKRTTGKKGAHILPFYQDAAEALVVEGWATGVSLNIILRDNLDLARRYRVVVAGGCGMSSKIAEQLKQKEIPAYVIHEDDGAGTPEGELFFPTHNGGNDCNDWLHHQPTVELFTNQLRNYTHG